MTTSHSESHPPKAASLIKGVEHVAIATRDPQALANWYIQHLNFALLLDTGATVYIKTRNSVVLEFVIADNVPPASQIRDAGIRHIPFMVDDLESARAQLQSIGIEFDAAPVVLPGMLLHFFRDPEGNYLHLVCREKRLI